MSKQSQTRWRTVGTAFLALLPSIIACGDDGGASEFPGTTGNPTSSTGGTQGATGEDTDADASDATDGSGGDDPAFTPESAIEALVQARCDWLFSCCAAGEAALTVGPFTTDAADCRARVLAALNTGSADVPVGAGPSDLLLLLSYSYAAGRVTLVEDSVTACAESLVGVPCNAAPEDVGDVPEPFCTPGQTTTTACELQAMAVGQLAEGEPCEPTLGVECGEGLACLPIGDTGVCAVASQEGDFCFADQDCTPPFFCDLGSGACVRASAEGEPCAYEDPEAPVPGSETIRCQTGLVCDPVGQTCVGTCSTGAPCTGEADCPQDHDCVLGRCVTPQGEGAPCQFGADCETGFCDEGVCAGLGANGSDCIPHAQCESQFCHPFFNTCEPQRGDGEPCDSFDDQQCAGGVCDNSTPTDPTCVALGSEGDACVSSLDCNIEAGLECIDAMCTPVPRPNGSSCFNGTQCESGLCWQSTCEDPTPVGDDCVTIPDPEVRPCGIDAFCDASPGSTEGRCAALRSPGEPCGASNECWGLCTVAWGQFLCDDTPPLGAGWCDGAE